MSENTGQSPKSWDTSLPTLVISVVGAVMVPPSQTTSGLASGEQLLASAILPLMGVAILFALATVAMSAQGKHRSSGFWGILSLLSVDVGAFLAWQYGVGSSMVPLVVAVATVPFAVMMALRETAWRRSDTPNAATT